MKRFFTQFRFILVFLTIFGLGVSSGCASRSEEPQPPEIVYGQDLCSQCGMVIGEARFASATLLTNGEYLKFDDVGEMLAYHKKHPEAQVKAWFVHDYLSEDWARGEAAFFVKSASLQTPMGTGIVAFKNRPDAEKFAAENNSKVYNLDEIRAQGM